MFATTVHPFGPHSPMTNKKCTIDDHDQIFIDHHDYPLMADCVCCCETCKAVPASGTHVGSEILSSNKKCRFSKNVFRKIEDEEQNNETRIKNTAKVKASYQIFCSLSKFFFTCFIGYIVRAGQVFENQ